MVQSRDLPEFENQRAELYGRLSQVGDFRRGGLHEVRRKCGKPNCACADAEHPGHGPQYNLTRSVGGRTVNVHLKPGPELDKVRAEVGNYHRFRSILREVIEVNEQICELRPPEQMAAIASPGEGPVKKAGSTRASRQSSRPR